MKKTDEQKVKSLFPCAYCYEMDGAFRICDFPGRDGMDIGKGKTVIDAWKSASSRFQRRKM